jgi:hypothetical protein
MRRTRVSAPHFVRSVKDWFMPKRNLRIIKRVKNVPVIGICESCQEQFRAEHQPAGQQSRAQAVIQQQFNAHKCSAAVEK